MKVRPTPSTAAIRRVPSGELTVIEVDALLTLLRDAFMARGGFDDDDWEHALGGVHFLLEVDGTIVAHASVVERSLEIAGIPLRTGYVEAVATDPRFQRGGYGTRLMEDVAAYIEGGFELGGLSTGSPTFYARLGWLGWQGMTFVRSEHGLERTPEDDDALMVRPTPISPPVDRSASISCEWRPGAVW